MRRFVGRTSWLRSARWLTGLLISILSACGHGDGAGSSDGRQDRIAVLGPGVAVGLETLGEGDSVTLSRDLGKSGGDAGSSKDRVALRATAEDRADASEVEEAADRTTSEAVGPSAPSAVWAGDEPPTEATEDPRTMRASVALGEVAGQRVAPEAVPEETPTRAPAPVDDSFEAVLGDPREMPLEVLVNDAGEDLVIVDVEPPDMGGTIKNDGHRLLYTSPPHFTGTEVFSYRVRDGNGQTRQAAVKVTVSDDRVDLASADDSFEGIGKGSVEIPLDVLSNDAGESLAIADVEPPDMGGTIRSDGRRLLYTPPSHFTGTEVFSYRVRDHHGGTGTAVVKVTVDAATRTSRSLDAALPDSAIASFESVGSADGDRFVRESGRIEITKRLNVRQGRPSTGARWLRTIPVGTVIEYSGWTSGGEVVDGIGHWYEDLDGNFFWAGGTVASTPEASGSGRAATPQPGADADQSSVVAFVHESGRIDITERLNVRQGRPSTRARWLRTIPAAAVIEYSGWTSSGEVVDGNGHWYKDFDGNFFWAGGTVAPTPRREAQESNGEAMPAAMATKKP